MDCETLSVGEATQASSANIRDMVLQVVPNAR